MSDDQSERLNNQLNGLHILVTIFGSAILMALVYIAYEISRLPH